MKKNTQRAMNVFIQSSNVDSEKILKSMVDQLMGMGLTFDQAIDNILVENGFNGSFPEEVLERLREPTNS